MRKNNTYNGEKKSNVGVDDFFFGRSEGVTLRIECKDSAENVGGFNLFSKMLGDYPQDIVMTVVGKKNNNIL